MTTLAVLIICISLVIVVLSGFAPRRLAPNARIVERVAGYWRIECICRECGTSRFITHPWPDAPQVILCVECGANIVPLFPDEDLRKFLAARQEALARDGSTPDSRAKFAGITGGDQVV